MLLRVKFTACWLLCLCFSEAEIAAGAERGEIFPTVGQDNRLNSRFLDLRTPANQAIFVIQSAVTQVGYFL